MIIVKQLKDNLSQIELVTESSKAIYKELDKFLVKRKDQLLREFKSYLEDFGNYLPDKFIDEIKSFLNGIQSLSIIIT